MAYLNFTNALMEAKRRAQLQGRPISQQEVQGIAQGYASSAAEKNIQEQGLGLQEKGLEAQKSQFAQTLAQRKYETEEELKAAKEQRETEKARALGTTVGAIGGGVAGGFAGSAVPGVGTYWGAVGGSMVGGSVGGALGPYEPGNKYVANQMCIIISSCTSPDSYEVNIARGYRDKFMDEITLTGYYSLCLFLVPLIQKYPRFKKLVKRFLVDRLVDYGECCLRYKEKRKYLTSGLVKGPFLGFCRILGKGVNAFLEVQHG